MNYNQKKGVQNINFRNMKAIISVDGLETRINEETYLKPIIVIVSDGGLIDMKFSS